MENTIEELLPHIKKSLEDPKVKYVKVFKGMLPENENRVVAEEEKRSPLDKLIEKCEEEDEKEKDLLKHLKRSQPIPYVKRSK